MSAPIVSEKFVIQSYETDVKARLKPTFLQDHLQEAAYHGSEFCGASYEQLREKNLFWALNRMHFHVYEWPLWNDEVELRTWSRAQVGPLYHRNFRLFKDDKVIAEATSAWTILDLGARSIWRGEAPFDASLHYDEDTLPFCSKIVIPRDIVFEKGGERDALYSDLDTNSHVNNCVYPGWAVDTLPLEYLMDRDLHDVQICYYHEIHAGDKVELLRAKAPDSEVWYVQGLANGTQAFVIRLEF